MKPIKLIIIAIPLLLLISCDPSLLLGGSGSTVTVTIEQRITLFQNALNQTDRSNLYTHFHPGMTNYQQVASAAVFDSGPLSYANHDFSIVLPDTYTDVAGGQKRVNAQLFHVANQGSATGYPLMLLMELDTVGENQVAWKIRELTLTVDPNEYTLQKLTSY